MGKLDILRNGLDEEHLNMDELLKDVMSGSLDLDLHVSEMELEDVSHRVVANWTIEQYCIADEYSLLTVTGVEVGKIKLTDDLPASVGSGTEAFSTLERYGLVLSDESRQFLAAYESETPYDILNKLVNDRTGQDIDILAVLEEQQHPTL